MHLPLFRPYFAVSIMKKNDFITFHSLWTPYLSWGSTAPHHTSKASSYKKIDRGLKTPRLGKQPG